MKELQKQPVEKTTPTQAPSRLQVGAYPTAEFSGSEEDRSPDLAALPAKNLRRSRPCPEFTGVSAARSGWQRSLWFCARTSSQVGLKISRSFCSSMLSLCVCCAIYGTIKTSCGVSAKLSHSLHAPSRRHQDLQSHPASSAPLPPCPQRHRPIFPTPSPRTTELCLPLLLPPRPSWPRPRPRCSWQPCAFLCPFLLRVSSAPNLSLLRTAVSPKSQFWDYGGSTTLPQCELGVWAGALTEWACPRTVHRSITSGLTLTTCLSTWPQRRRCPL